MLIKLRFWTKHASAAFILRSREHTLTCATSTFLRMRFFCRMVNFGACLCICRPLSCIFSESNDIVFYHLAISFSIDKCFIDLHLSNFFAFKIVFFQCSHN